MLSLVVWNIQYRRAGSADGHENRAAIAAFDPDIVCITAGHPDFLDMPRQIEAGGDLGYPANDGRRKVLIWSRRPWCAVDAAGDEAMPPGRCVVGQTDAPVGTLQVHGVCIPWSHAHVSHDRGDRKLWEEHLLYLRGLRRILREPPAGVLRSVAGDHDQATPRIRAPAHVFEALMQAFQPGIRHATAGLIPPLARPAIDHVSLDDDLEVIKL